MSWKEFKLDDLIKIKHGYAFKGEYFSDEATTDILVTPGNFLIGGGFKYDKLKYYKGPILKDYILKKDDVIVTMTDLSKQADTLGFSARIPEIDNCTLLHNQRIGLIQLKGIDFDLGFIYWLMRTEEYQRFVAGSSTGSTVKHTSPSKICGYKFYAPSNINTQKRIASVLSAYDDLIENNLKRIKLLEELAQHTYEEWFVKFRINGEQLEVGENGLPDDWEEKEFHFFGEIITGKTPSTLNEDFFNGNIPFVKTPDMSGFPYVLDTNQKLSKLGASTQEKKFIPKNSLMISCIGSAGIYALASQDCQTNQQINSIAFFEEYYSFYFYCFAKKLKPILEGLGSNGATMTNVNKGKFEKMKAIFPKKEVLINFHNQVENNFAVILNLQSQNRLLKESRDILLPRLMSGKIDVQKINVELEPKVISLPTEKTKEASKEFKEAVLISVLTEKFGSEKFPLGRKRYTKLSYLFHRHADNQIQDYLRKAAGPYNPKTRYQGPEKIAHQNGYVVDHKNGNISGFIAGAKIDVAQKYFQNYWSLDYLNWLESQFKYKSNDELELYATVDSTIIELHKNNLSVSVENVKEIIKREPEWKAKLERDIFSDGNIARAIGFLPTVFNY